MQTNPHTHPAQDRLLRLPDVKHQTGLSRTTLYELMGLPAAQGGFPRPIKVHRISVWSENEVQSWIESLKASRVAA
jgi:prophage regulatory protein